MSLRPLVALLCLIVVACQQEAPHRDPEAEYGQLHTIAFAGDTVLARRMNSFVEEHGPGRPLSGVREILSGADVAVVNLECILASSGEPADKGENNPYLFRGRPELVRVLTEAGVDVASLANNHSGDYGPDAVSEGVRILRAAGVDPVGAGDDVNEAMAPVFRQVGDTVVAFIAMDMTQDRVEATVDRAGPHYVSEGTPHDVVARVREQVQLARRYAHLVFLVTHWGSNYDEEPSDAHRSLVRRLIRDAGIDGLLGSSAHQTQGMEVFDGRPIIHDAGDLIFDFNSDGWTHKTAIFMLHFDRVGVRWVEAIPVRMGWGTARPANDEESAEMVARINDLSRRLGTKLWLEDGRALLGVWGTRPRAEPREPYRPPPRRKQLLPTPTSYQPTGVVVKALPSTATPLQVRLEGGIELLGYEMPKRARRGHGVRITTYWRTSRAISKSFKVFTHVQHESKTGRRWQGDHQPGDWMYPTKRWRPGEIVRDAHQIRPPGNSKSGPHEVFVGLFLKQRLKVLDDDQHDGRNRIRLGVLEVH